MRKGLVMIKAACAQEVSDEIAFHPRPVRTNEYENLMGWFIARNEMVWVLEQMPIKERTHSQGYLMYVQEILLKSALGTITYTISRIQITCDDNQ